MGSFIYSLRLTKWPQPGGPGITNSYDYDAPLDEYGYPNEPKYSHLSKLHSILLDFSDSILQNDPPQPLNLGTYQVCL